MPSIPFRVTQTGISTTAGYTSLYVVDWMVRPVNIGIGCVVNSTAVTYSVQHTFDYTGSSDFISSNATWFNNVNISGVSTNADSNYAFPVTAIRLATTAGSSIGTVQMTVIQSG